MFPFRLALLALASVCCAPLWGQNPPEPIKLGSVILSGSVRTRLENWKWFDGDSGDPLYSFLGNHLRLNFTRPGRMVDWTLELESPILLGLPDDAIAAGAQGQLGMGATYFAANDRRQNVGMIFPKQAFIRVKNLGSESSSLRLGRFEFQDGSEVTARNASLGVIKRDRIHQRLIGPFVFTHVMRSFDGFHYVYNKPRINYTLIGAFPTRGVFQVDGWGWMKTAFAYASATGQVQRGKTQTGEWRLFGIYYQDWRHIVKTDNRPAAVRATDFANVRIATYGGHYVHISETPSGTFDYLAIAAGQFGRFGSLDHLAGMVDLEIGFQPKILPKLKPWIRAGYYYGTGDGNPSDNKHGTFFQNLPTPRPFARFPFFDMMNNEDFMAMLTIRPHSRVTLKGEFHGLRLANRNDLWYAGGGAFQPWTFGYQGRPSNNGKGLGNLYDLSTDVTINPHFAFQLYYGFIQGKSVIKSIYPRGKDGHLGFVEATYRF